MLRSPKDRRASDPKSRRTSDPPLYPMAGRETTQANHRASSGDGAEGAPGSELSHQWEGSAHAKKNLEEIPKL